MRKTYLYTRHEWGEAAAVHRLAVLRVQESEDETAYQLVGLDDGRKETGDLGDRRTNYLSP